MAAYVRFYYGYEPPAEKKTRTINEWYMDNRNPVDPDEEILKRWNELSYIQKHPFPLRIYATLVEGK